MAEQVAAGVSESDSSLQLKQEMERHGFLVKGSLGAGRSNPDPARNLTYRMTQRQIPGKGSYSRVMVGRSEHYSCTVAFKIIDKRCRRNLIYRNDLYYLAYRNSAPSGPAASTSSASWAASYASSETSTTTTSSESTRSGRG